MEKNTKKAAISIGIRSRAEDIAGSTTKETGLAGAGIDPRWFTGNESKSH